MTPQFNFVGAAYQNDNIHVFQAYLTKFMSILGSTTSKKGHLKLCLH
jgi:hypothetical protein